MARESSVDHLSMVGVAPDFDSAGWSADQRKEVEDFCARFARNRHGNVLGWKGSAGLLVMQHRAPDNLPMVLWQTKGKSQRRDGWYPLFPNGHIPGPVADALAAQNQQRREHISGRSGRDRVLGPYLSSVLDALQRGARTPERISALADIPLTQSYDLCRARRRRVCRCSRIPDGPRQKTSHIRCAADGPVSVERVRRALLSSRTEESR